MTAAAEPGRGGTGHIFRRVLANAGKLLGGRTVNAGISLAYISVTTRALGLHDFGVLAMIHAFAQFLGDVVKFQSWQTILQFGAEPFAERRLPDFHRIVRFTVMLDVVSGLVAIAIGVVGGLLLGPKLGWTSAQAPLVAAYSLSSAFMAAAAPLGLLRLFDRFDVMAGQAVVTSTIRLIGGALGLWLHWSLSAFLLIWAVSTLVGFVYLCGGAWYEFRRRELQEGFSWRGPWSAGVAGAWRFSWATNLNGTLSTAFTHMVTLFVGALLGPTDAGLWRVGRQVADAIAKPAKLLTPALYPELARLRADGGERKMWRLVGQVALAAGVLGGLLLIVSTFAGGPLLSLIAGKGYDAAADVMTWQVAAAVIGLLALPLETLVISLGQAGSTVWIRVVVAAAFAVALPSLVRAFGVDGAGAGLVATSVALALGMLWLLLRRRRRDKIEQTACESPPIGLEGEL